ncbi:ankyrin repeat domain-containing protein 26-like, partial [Tupaia chinensis]|uniref:ankyrin repeat domain-containing protein 26-like n=1 Tax=Tupaia chinensis TaxID=246437 RepID=UPI000FFB8B46
MSFFVPGSLPRSRITFSCHVSLGSWAVVLSQTSLVLDDLDSLEESWKKRNQTIDINVADRCEDRKPKENINPLSKYHVRHRDLGKIHKATLTGNVAEVQRILLLNKNGLNEPDKCERTALHLACASDHPEVVRLLAERKCQLDLLDGDQKTALIKAIQCRNEECASILLEHGADPNVTDYRGNAALHYAAAHDNVSIAEKLLSHNAPIEAKNE